MDINLLSQNLLIVLSLLIAAMATIIVIFVDKSWRRLKHFNPKTILSLVAAFLLAAAFQTAIRLSYPHQQLPTLWLMALPFTLSLALIFPSWTSKKIFLKPLSVVCVLCGLALSASIINNYYSFYPTLFSVFTNDTQNLLKQQNRGLPAPSKTRNITVESSLYKPSPDGELSTILIPGKVSKFSPRQEWLYTPPIAVEQPNLKLPVMVLIPGSPGMPYNWITAGLKQTMDSFAKSHHGIAPYALIVDDTGSLANDTECVNSPRGNIETYLTVDVPTYIKQHLKNIETAPQDWAIGGLSMGGTCSIMLALRHPNIYPNFLDFGGEIGPEVGDQKTTIDNLFYGSHKLWQEHQPVWLLKHNKYRRYHMNGYFEIGSSDLSALIAQNKKLYKISKASGINAVFRETTGGHTFGVEGQSFMDALPWISNALGATNL